MTTDRACPHRCGRTEFQYGVDRARGFLISLAAVVMFWAPLFAWFKGWI